MIAAMPAVYTALIGGYERLNEQPMAAESALPFVCFTDDPSLVSQTWKIEVVEPAFLRDPVRSARRLKILGHPQLAGFEETLWIDNSVILDVPPEDILAEWLASADLAMPRHSYRDIVMDEFDAVTRAGFDDTARVYEQLHHYLETVPEVLMAPPLWSAILARRHTPAVTALGEIWFEHVLRYSRRDQLSIRMALHLSPDVEVRAVPIDNHRSPHHHWPVAVSRHMSGAPREPIENAKPLVARVRSMELEIAELGERLAAAGRREEEAAGLRQQAGQLEVVAADLRLQLAEMRASRTWRMGRHLARAAGLFARFRSGA